MNSRERPLAVTVLACLYLAVGVVGFFYHLQPILAAHAIQRDDLFVELSEVIAVGCGFFLLRGENWARWLALAWMAFHVAISFFDSWEKVAAHAVFLAVIAYALFRPQSNAYFLKREESAS